MAKKTSHSIGSRLVRHRAWMQAAFLLVWLDPFMLRLHNVCSPVFHCYSCPLATFACPIGVLANFSALHLFPFVAAGILLVIGATLGRLVCGWVCPFGFLQDLIARIPTPKFDLPAWAGHCRYAVLILFVVAIPYFFGEDHPLFFCRLCPAGALEGALPNAARIAVAGGGLVLPSATKLTILTIVATAMFFTRRPWCALLCPLGAIYSLFNRVSFLFLRFHPDQCKACDNCKKLCNSGVLPDRGLNHAQCIRCLECTRCPAISIGTAAGSGRRNTARTGTGRQTPEKN